MPAVAGGWGGARDGPKTYLHLTDETIEEHLRGRESIGIYPLLKDDTCWFLACDLDGKTWQLDAAALLEACADTGCRRRWSGVAPATARTSGSSSPWRWRRLRRAGSGRSCCARRWHAERELDLASYDRLFPNQDFLPQKGFGNLIALPLQGRCREAGTSVFLDPATFEPGLTSGLCSARSNGCHPNSSRLCSPRAATSRSARPRSSRNDAPRPDKRLPAEISCTIGADLAIPKASLPPALLAELKHLASLHNPLFYERQRLRLSTHQTPRLIRCYDETLTHLQLPRGLREQLDLASGRPEAGS